MKILPGQLLPFQRGIVIHPQLNRSGKEKCLYPKHHKTIEMLQMYVSVVRESELLGVLGEFQRVWKCEALPRH